MAKKKTDVELEEEVVPFDTTGLSEEDVVEVICNAVEQLCLTMEEKGLDPELITASLFRMFAERMSDAGDRETYELVLTTALEEEWEEVTIH